MKKLMEKVALMFVGGFLLCGGVFFGARITNANGTSFHAGTMTSEEVLKAKSAIIEQVVEIDSSISNKFIASRKAGELSNLDVEKLQEISSKGLVIVVVPQEDVYQSIDATKAEENKRNGVITDSVYIPSDNKLIVSLSAPSGVLTQQVASIVK